MFEFYILTNFTGVIICGITYTNDVIWTVLWVQFVKLSILMSR